MRAETPAERRAAERRLSEAHAYAVAVPTSWPQALRDTRALDDKQLEAARRSPVVDQVRRERGLA